MPRSANPDQLAGHVTTETTVDSFGIDPRLGDLIEAAASEALGERYVDLWLAEDRQAYVLGIIEPTTADQALAASWAEIAPVSVVACPVGRHELDQAVQEVAKAVGPDMVLAGPDYINGRVVLEVPADKVDEAISDLDQETGLLPVDQQAAPPASDPSQIVVEVEISETAAPAETLKPAESNNHGPPRAGKTVTNTSRGLSCTASTLVKSGSKWHMLTAGHCGHVGDTLTMGSTTVGSMGYSNWFAVGTGGSAKGDIGRFSVPETAKPSVYISPTKAQQVTGWAAPRVGETVCFRGQTTDAERCGSIIMNGFQTDPGYGRVVTGLSLAKMQVRAGDSGSPVYYKGANGVVMTGIISGVMGDLALFTPIGPALSATKSTLVRAPGLGAPPIASSQLDRPYSQILLSPDMTGDGRGEVLALDQAGKLSIYETTAKGTLRTPAGLVAVGLTGHTIYAPGDWDGDGMADLVTVSAGGRMYLHKGQGGGAVSAKRQIGHGWSKYTIIPAGDLTGNGVNDMLAISNQTGVLLLYSGNGKGGFKSGYKQVGHGWKDMQLFAAGDLNSDGATDVLGVKADGRLFFYAGRGDGYFKPAVQVGHGWKNLTLAAGADLTGNGRADIVGKTKDGRLWLYQGKGAGTFARPVQIGSGW